MKFVHRVALLAGSLLFAAGPAAAIAAAGNGELGFIARQSDVALEGNFRRFVADVQFDPAHPQDGRVRIDIDLASVDAGGPDADGLIGGKDFFDVAHFPGARFVASKITPVADGSYLATGPFTLKGTSVEIAIPFTVQQEASGLRFEGSATISRAAFHVGEGQWSDPTTLDDAVQIRFYLNVAP